MAKADYRKEQDSFGPGGYHCPCCGPRDSDEKVRVRRKQRRKVRSAKVLEDGTFVIRGTFGRKKLRQDQGPKEWED